MSSLLRPFSSVEGSKVYAGEVAVGRLTISVALGVDTPW
jgi:hypothetical protein